MFGSSFTNTMGKTMSVVANLRIAVFRKGLRTTPDALKVRNHFSFPFLLFFFVSIFISIDFLIVTAQKEHESIVFLDDKCSFYYTCLEMLVLLQWCYVAKYFHERDFLFFFFPFFLSFVRRGNRRNEIEEEIVNVLRKKYDLRQTFFTSKSEFQNRISMVEKKDFFNVCVCV